MNNLNNFKRHIYALVFLFSFMADFTLHAQNCSVNAGNSLSICPNELPITLNGNVSATNVVQSSLQWSLGTTPAGSTVDINSPQSLSTSINGTMPVGDYVFVLGISCTDGSFIQDSIVLTVAEEPTMAMVTSPSSFGCYDGTGIPLAGNSGVAGEIASWRVVSGEAGYFDNANSTSPNFFPDVDFDECKTGPNGYVSRLEYRITRGNCYSSDIIDVAFTDSKDSFSVLSTNALTCGFCTDLFASCALDGTGQWTYSGPGNAAFGNNTWNNTDVCVDQAGDYTFTWAVTGGCREGTKSVTVTFQEFGTEGFRPEAGEDQVYCEIPPSISLTATPYGNGQMGGWSQIKGLPAFIHDPANPSTQVDSLLADGGPYWFLWAVNGLDCVLFDTVKIFQRPTWGFSELFDLSCSLDYNAYEDEILVTKPIPYNVLDDFEVSITFLEVPYGYEDEIIFFPQAVGSSPGSVNSAKISMDVFNDGSPKDTAQLGIPFNYSIPASLVFQKASNAVLSHEEFSFTLGFDKYQPRGFYKYSVTVTSACGSFSFAREYTNSGFSMLSPKAGSDVRLDCGVLNTSLAGTGLYYPGPLDQIKVHTGAWYTVEAPGNDPLNDSNRYLTNPAIDSLAEGIYTYRYMGLFGGECDLSYDDVKVYVSTGPASGINVYLNQTAVCGTGVAQLIAEAGTSSELGTWTQISPAITTEQVITTASQDTAYFFDLIPNTSYAIEYTNSNSCGGGSDTIYFTTNAFQGPSLSQIYEEFACISSVSSYDLLAEPVVHGQGTWSVVSAPAGSTPAFSSPGSNATTISGLTVEGVYQVKFSILNSPCTIPSEDYITISLGTAPVLSAGEDIYDCQTVFPYTTNMAAESATGGTAYWTCISGASLPDIADPGSPTTAVTFKKPGTYRIGWVSGYTNCSQEVDIIEVVLGEMSTIAQAGPDQQHCDENGVFSLDAAELASGEYGTWTVSSTTGDMDVFFADPADPNTSVTLSNSGMATLKWTSLAKTSSCGTDDEVILEWHAPAAAGDDFSQCNATSVELIGNNYSGIDSFDVLWTVVSGPNTPVIESETEESTIVGGLIPGTYVFNYSVTTNLCSTNDDITVNVSPVDLAVIGDDQVICSGTTISLSANAAVSGSSLWYILNGEDTGTFSAINSNTTTYGPAVTNENYIFAYSLDNGTCITYDYTRIYVLDDSDVSYTISKADCGSSTGGISLDFDEIPTDALNFNWSNGATTQNISNLASGFYDVTVSSDSGCEYFASIPLNNADGPTIDFGNAIDICTGESAFIDPSIARGSPPYSFLWETGETTASINVSPTGSQNYILTVTDNANCSNIGVVTVEPNPVALVELGDDITHCNEPIALTPSVIPPAGFSDRAPFNENDFDTGFKDWTQGTDDDIEWAIVDPGTSPGSSIAYVEGTAVMEQIANLYSPTVDLTDRFNVYFEFDYLFSGSNARDFYLEISVDSAASWSRLWTVSGVDNNYRNTQLSLVDYLGLSNVQLRFVGITGSSSKSDIWLTRVSFDDAKSAYDYNWSTGETTQDIIIPEGNEGTYLVTLTDPNGCEVTDQLDVAFFCLPITMGYFLAEESNCRVKILWETQEEIDVARFEIEKSIDGINYGRVASLPAVGGEEANLYEIYDEEPQNINYYRLKIINLDKTHEYYKLQLPITTNCFEDRANGITELYPNPTAGKKVYLKYYTQLVETVTIEILDLQGRKISSSNFQSTVGSDIIDLNIKSLPAGVYFVKLKGEDWQSATKKFVKISK